MFRALFLLPVFLSAGILDWFDSISPKAEKAKQALNGLDQEIEKALKDFQVPGVAIAIVVDGHVIYEKGFGFRDLESKLPVTPDTMFAIGSCTKAFTSFAAGKLVDEGICEWDAPIIDILPEVRLSDEYATTKLTLRDLLTHRTGLPRHDFVYYNAKITRAELLKRIRYLQPSYELRERYHYGQLAYFIAGLAIERASGQTWENLYREKILLPLGMKHTNFSVEDNQRTANFACPYMDRHDALKKVPFRDLSLIGPAGAMNSNIVDMTHWIKMHLASGNYDGKQLISAATLQELRSPQVVMPGVPETKDAILYSYGIGWMIASYRGHYFVSHDGISDGFTSVTCLLPHENIGVVVLSNKNMSAFPRYLSFVAIDRVLHLQQREWFKEGIESLRKNKEAQKERKISDNLARKVHSAPSHPLKEYVGVYENPGYGKLHMELVDGKLEANYNDLRFGLDHWHYDVFSIVDEKQDTIISFEGSKFTFTNNAHGEVASVSIPFEPNCNDIVFKRNAAEQHSTTTYLKQFVGTYEIYGYTIDIMLKNHTLIAIIPGQPNYELVPTTENEFAVKSVLGSTVRFIMNGDKVEEALLVHPYGAFSIYPKGS